MIYKDFEGKKISALAFGMMRLPQNPDGTINKDDTSQMIDLAIEKGVNYFDTAWGYHEGNSELVAGELLKKYPRESYYLATKFPGYDNSNFGKVEEIFEQQLKKCRVDYFDFYLLHNVYEKNTDLYLDDEKYGTVSYLQEQQKKGRIRHLGFSAHGTVENMKYFLDNCGFKPEFCQIQLNYIDWHFQEAKEKVELLNSYGIPIWVMEPLRGGKLASLSEKDTEKLIKLRPNESVPSWALRFLQSVFGVVTVLSGMSDITQVKENIKTFEEEKPLNNDEFDTLIAIADGMVNKDSLPCTACRYCTSHCPVGIDIPRILSLYNEHNFTGGGFLASMAVDAIEPEKRPNSCIACRSCEAVCPQQIKIADAMADFSEKLGLNK